MSNTHRVGDLELGEAPSGAGEWAFQRAGWAVLALLLYVPVLIFGAGAVEATAGGVSPQGHLLLLGAISLGAAVLAPWAVAAALRTSME